MARSSSCVSNNLADFSLNYDENSKQHIFVLWWRVCRSSEECWECTWVSADKNHKERKKRLSNPLFKLSFGFSFPFFRLIFYLIRFLPIRFPFKCQRFCWLVEWSALSNERYNFYHLKAGHFVYHTYKH